MARKRLLISTFVLLAALLGFNLIVGRLARTLPRLILGEAQRAAKVDTLLLGNSLLMAGFSENAYRQNLPSGTASGPALNLACGGTMPAETLQFLEVARKRFPQIPYVIYGYMFDHLTAPTEAGWHDLAGNRAIFYYADFELGLSLYHPRNALENFQCRLTRLLPAVYERFNVWRRVELLRRRFDRWGLPPEAATRFGRAADFVSDPFQPKDKESFAINCRRAVQEHVPLSIPVKEIIRRARAAGAKVIVVEMPLPVERRQFFGAGEAWKVYRQHVRGLIEGEGAAYLDALDWFSDDERYFMDYVHLNPAGAVEFSRRLGEFVGGRNEK